MLKVFGTAILESIELIFCQWLKRGLLPEELNAATVGVL